MLFALILFIPFFIIYLFLPKQMWKHYFNDTPRFVIMGVVFLILFGSLYVLFGRFPWGSFGFWFMDPISYTMTTWQRIKSSDKAS